MNKSALLLSASLLICACSSANALNLVKFFTADTGEDLYIDTDSLQKDGHLAGAKVTIAKPGKGVRTGFYIINCSKNITAEYFYTDYDTEGRVISIYDAIDPDNLIWEKIQKNSAGETLKAIICWEPKKPSKR